MFKCLVSKSMDFNGFQWLYALSSHNSLHRKHCGQCLSMFKPCLSFQMLFNTVWVIFSFTLHHISLWFSRMIASTNGQMNLHINTVQFDWLCSTKGIGSISISLSKDHKPISFSTLCMIKLVAFYHLHLALLFYAVWLPSYWCNTIRSI